jgi:carbon monoxide dehydrogenase subunit G
MKTLFLLAGSILCGSLPAWAILPLTESTFTEIIQEANVVTATNKGGAPARTNTLFKVPDLVRTGQESRVELTAKDQTITRVGASTTFTFAASGRDILLKKGGVLFHAPAGAGGGAIKYRGSSAAVLGTTMIGEVLPDGRFKVLDLEGSVKVFLSSGEFVTLKPGQMVIVSADGGALGETMDFNLGELVARSQLVVGFSHPLSSMPLIEAAIHQQNQQISSGQLYRLATLQVVSFGLDMRYRGLNDLPFYSFNPVGEGNPLDFPGLGPIGSTPGGPGGYSLLPPVFLFAFPPIINPPSVTNPNFPHP